MKRPTFAISGLASALLVGTGLLSWQVSSVEQRPNILLVIADDLGAEACPWSPPIEPGQKRTFAPMPHLEELRKSGMLFTRTWSMPTCSPSRASIITGRFPFRHGVGRPIPPNATRVMQLPLAERTLPEVFKQAHSGYALTHIGKWHLSLGINDPRLQGWDHFIGLIQGMHTSYTDWQETMDTTITRCMIYSPTEMIDRAIRWTDSQRTPWFCWLALTSPHQPFHLPPAELRSPTTHDGSKRDIKKHPADYRRLMIQAMDHEIGRLLDRVDLEKTYVIFIGDNGTDPLAIEPPYDPGHAKGSLFEQGLQVPLIVAGPGIGAGSSCDALVSLTDLFATILDLAQVPMPTDPDRPLDARSLVPLLRDPTSSDRRSWVFAEQFGPEFIADERIAVRTLSSRAIRGERYKVIIDQQGGRHIYDLALDPLERTDLCMPVDLDPHGEVDELQCILDEMPVPGR